MPCALISCCDDRLIVLTAIRQSASFSAVASVRIGQAQDGSQLCDKDGDCVAAVTRHILLWIWVSVWTLS